MSTRIEFSSAAKETYNSIQLQILYRWGSTALAKFEKKTLRTLGLISQTPFIYQAIEGNENLRKAVINKNCSVFYEVKPSEIRILYFWDNRQEPIL